MRNGYSFYTLTSVDKQELLETAGKANKVKVAI